MLVELRLYERKRGIFENGSLGMGRRKGLGGTSELKVRYGQDETASLRIQEWHR